MICNQPFTYVRTVGRPPSLCGAECRRESNRRRQERWFARMKEAKARLAELQVAGMA